MQNVSQLSVEELLFQARRAGEGSNETPANLGEALAYAEEAARRDSADGYHEITRIVGSACIATEDLTLKEQYAAYLIGCCDPDTILRHKRGDTAYNVASVCAYMTDTLTACGDSTEADTYRNQAESYYHIALTLESFAPSPANHQAAQASRDDVNRLCPVPKPHPHPPTKQSNRLPAKTYILQ
ncbi:MAG: hypothetical protein PHW63_00385 [Alphaproteobacteria bacterium]|nr:hypothetical protein [Alphaproteobacteria bacterium]